MTQFFARVPIVSLAILALVGLASLAHETWIYDRGCVLDGDLWRLLTGHFVHFGSAHLVTNLLVILPASILLERVSRAETAMAMLIACFGVGAGLFWLDPDLGRFGGLSGIACALFAALACRWIATPMKRRAGIFLLVLLGLKLLLMDATNTHGGTLPESVVAVSLSHYLGTLAGLCSFAFFAAWKWTTTTHARARASSHTS